ncbi:MAG: hypothetical protein ACR2RB_11365 [Gammaproteobacteria bacterium]
MPMICEVLDPRHDRMQADPQARIEAIYELLEEFDYGIPGVRM